MPFEAMVVTIVGIVFGYKLLSQMLPKRTACDGRNCRHHRKSHKAPLMDYEEQEELRARAEELSRRVRTLEEIITDDAGVRS